jgi:hypothetical protein
MLNRRSLMAFAALVALMMMGSCSGKDGTQGPAGPRGTPGLPQPIKVLYAGGEAEGQLQSMAVQAFKEGLFPLGTEIHVVSLAGDSVPPLSVLRQFDAVMAWTNAASMYPDSLGDRLAEYVDAGGGLVLAQGAFVDFIPLGGRIFDPGYSPFNQVAGASIFTDRAVDYSSLEFPLHVIFNGTDVNNLTYPGDGAFGDPDLDPTATLIALENNGHKCIAVSANNRIIALNMWPRSVSSANALEALKLMANSCMFVAGAM